MKNVSKRKASVQIWGAKRADNRTKTEISLLNTSPISPIIHKRASNDNESTENNYENCFENFVDPESQIEPKFYILNDVAL